MCFALIKDGSKIRVDGHIDPDWLFWLIGFIEGDGAIYIGTQDNNSKMVLTITQKERQPLDEIKLVLGFGLVKYDNSASCYRYIVQDLKGIYLLSLLLI